MGNEDDYIE